MAKLEKPKSMLRKGVPPKENEASNNLTAADVQNDENIVNVEETKPLNLKVPNSFRKRFKNYATNNDITMSKLLITCFEEYAKKNNQYFDA